MYEYMLLIAAKTAILLLGGSITYYALRAYDRTGDPSLRALGTGFGVVTFGALVGGILHEFLGVAFMYGVAIDSTLTAIGFAVIFYSLYIK